MVTLASVAIVCCGCRCHSVVATVKGIKGVKVENKKKGKRGWGTMEMQWESDDGGGRQGGARK